MKLFIMHQQNCIQDLQIQNKELRAVIEGLVGPDDIDIGSSFVSTVVYLTSSNPIVWKYWPDTLE